MQVQGLGQVGCYWAHLLGQIRSTMWSMRNLGNQNVVSGSACG